MGRLDLWRHLRGQGAVLLEGGLVDDDAAVGAGGGGVWWQNLGVLIGADTAAAGVAGAGGRVFGGSAATLALDMESLVFSSFSAVEALGGRASLGLDSD